MATIKKNSKKKKIIIAVSVVLVIAIIGTVIAVAASSGQKTSVTLSTIGTGSIYETVSGTGTVTAGKTKEYKVGTVATVKEVFVQTGDEVKEGDVLATFDTSGLDEQISSLESTYQKARSDYLEAVEDQSTAKSNLSDLNNQIKSIEKQVEKLGGEIASAVTYTTTTAAKSTTAVAAATTTTTTTQPATTTTEAETTEQVTYPATIEDAMDALTDLVEAIISLTDDVEQTNEMISIVMQQISEEIAGGNYSAEKIAQYVGEAVAQAIQEGTIDSSQLAVDSSTAVEMIETALASIDWSALGASFASNSTVQLTALELQLSALYAQQQLYALSASDTAVTMKKQIMESAKSALDTVTEASEELEAGWTAAFDGTITACDISAGEQTTLLSSGITLENLDSMVVTLSLGEYDIHKVKVGMSATITSAYGTYSGEVLSKAATATGSSDSSLLDSLGSSIAGISGLSSLTSTSAGVEVTVSVDNTDENIIAGFDVDVEINVGDYEDIVVVPIESILLEKTGTYVYLYNEEEGTVTKTLIETGAVSDSEYEVTSGLEAGDRIISAPSSDYEEETFEVKVTN